MSLIEAFMWKVTQGETAEVKYMAGLPGVMSEYVCESAIHMAADLGWADIVDFLIELPYVGPTIGTCAFQIAAKAGHLEVAKLLGCRTDVHPFADNNWALKYAALNGHYDVVKFITGLPDVARTVDLNRVFELAAFSGHLDMVCYLAQKPYINAAYADNTPLRLAAARGNLEVIQYLKSLPCVQAAPLDKVKETAEVFGYGHMI